MILKSGFTRVSEGDLSNVGNHFGIGVSVISSDSHGFLMLPTDAAGCAWTSRQQVVVCDLTRLHGLSFVVAPDLRSQSACCCPIWRSG